MLNISESVTLDGMHCFFVNGVFNHAAGKLMQQLKASGINLAEVEEFAGMWKHPRQLSDSFSLHDVFSPDRMKS